MKTQLQKDWRKFLDTGGYCNPPGRAQCALDHARTLQEWRDAESAGLVRLRQEEEQESYLDSYGEPEAYTDMNGRRVSAEKAREELCELLDRKGCWWIVSEVFNGEEWEQADSIGMCAGYDDPCSPFENSYVPDLMRAALDRIPVCGEH